MSYTPSFTPTYQNGWQSSPSTATPITATPLNNYDNAIEHIEDYLANGGILDQTSADARYIIDRSLSLTKTLSASEDTMFIFSNNMITENSTVDVYASLNINYKSMTISNGECTVTYPKQDESVSMTCKIYIK